MVLREASVLKLNHEWMRRITLCALLIGGGAIFPSWIAAADKTEPNKKAQELFKELGKMEKVQELAVDKLKTDVKLKIEKKEKEIVSVERDMDDYKVQFAKVKKKYEAPCTAEYKDRAKYEYWTNFCDRLGFKWEGRAAKLKAKQRKLLAEREKQIERGKCLQKKWEAAQERIQIVVDTLQGIELPSYCRSCQQRRRGEEAVACYLQCWDPCEKLVNYCQGNPHGATLIPPQCECRQLPGVRTYDYERYSGGDRACFCSPRN